MEIKNKTKNPFNNKSRFGNWSNSSFWLGIDSDRPSKLDVIKLAEYKRAISNFVNIVTGRSDIHVKYNDNDVSYTDGKTVTISSKLSDGKSFDTTVGLALHEGSHCLLTNFNWIKTYFSVYSDYRRLITVKTLINVIEDRRIDSYIYKTAPGYRGYYEAMYDEYFYAKSINIAIKRKMKSTVNLSNYLFHIINIANPNRDEYALPGLKAIFDPPMFHINHGSKGWGGGGFAEGINKTANDIHRAVTFQEKTENLSNWGFSSIDIEFETL
jgi:hypothetical protein